MTMEITIPLRSGLALTIAEGPGRDARYPTSVLQKAFCLFYHGKSLAQEAVGFGFPLVKKGLTALFPGRADLSLLRSGDAWKVTALYRLTLAEKITLSGRDSTRLERLDPLRNLAAGLIRRIPALRGTLTNASCALRRKFGWETSFGEAGVDVQVKATYTVSPDAGTMAVVVEWPLPSVDGVTELIVMNEQGALHFDVYRDSAGVVLRGDEIGCWDEVLADNARFAGSSGGMEFSLPKVPGTRLFRGRELIDSRLAWAGFGYSMKPGVARFSYSLALGANR